MRERRLAAIVAADVAGYTRLMGGDESGTLDALMAHRAAVVDPLVAAHKGEIVKTTGDGLLLAFPSVVEAVACAVSIQGGIAARNRDVAPERQIRFRIGVHIGDVIAEDGDVFGDGVNLAARLEQIAEPGGICLSEDAARQVRGKIDADLLDGGRRSLKNVAQPVHVFRIAPPGASALPRPGAGGRRRRAIAGLVVGVLGLAGAAGLGVATGWFDLSGANGTAVSARHSYPVVAVLPFANQTGDTAQDYLADGVTDELIAAIGRFHMLRVIGRNAVQPYRGRAVPRSEIVDALGARYLVEGGVRRNDRRLRVAVRLTDAADGAVLWTDGFDGALTDLLDFQESVARQVAGKLAVNIRQVEVRRRTARPKPDPDAYDIVLRARSMGAALTRRENREVRTLAAQAIEKEPGYAPAHALLAEAILSQVILGWTEFADRELARVEALARRAIALAPDEPDGHRALGRFLALRGEYAEALAALRGAIEINPSDTVAIAAWGAILLYSGDLSGAIEALERAARYDPALDPVYLLDLSAGYYFAGRYEDSLRAARRALDRYPDFVTLDLIAAAAAARLGRTADAEHFVKKIRARMPNYDFSDVGSRYRNPAFAQDLRAGLARAGIPVGEPPPRAP